VNSVKLLQQPGDGVMPLIKGINGAKGSLEIAIFRFDQREIERALIAAVNRGVSVHALIAHTNRTGEENLRKLEMRLLAAGVTVARTADDLVRYHDKMMIVDRRELFLLAFNFTYLDIAHSRSFGIVTRNPKLVREAGKLFEADVRRHPYEAGLGKFLVSPVNARQQLASFIRRTKTQLLIYDPEISDPAMTRLLEDRAKAGVEIRIIGRLSRRRSALEARKLALLRLHTRTMISDGRFAFVGSQSLREVELDARREVGLIVSERKIVSQLAHIFMEDWASTEQAPAHDEKECAEPAARLARKVAKAVARDLPPVAPILDVAVKEIVGENVDKELDAKEVEDIVKDAVKQAVREVVRDAVEGVVEQNGNAKVAR
jgi:cardiolipin synthase A/B